jgi:SAM-dependent methyltransferase
MRHKTFENNTFLFSTLSKNEHDEDVLKISEWQIRKNAPSILSFIPLSIKQFISERSYKQSGVDFRKTNPDEVKKAYGSMNDVGFQMINARQEWANWRTIPRSMSGRIPRRPIKILDVGCGAGTSSEILALYLPAGSSILGIDLTPSLIEIAKQKSYKNTDGDAIKTEFLVQPATETIRMHDGSPLPDESIDYVNTSGVVGHHLTTSQLEAFASEIHRILKKKAYAAIDSGPNLKKEQIVPILMHHGFLFEKRIKAFWIDPRGQLIFQKA